MKPSTLALALALAAPAGLESCSGHEKRQDIFNCPTGYICCETAKEVGDSLSGVSELKNNGCFAEAGDVYSVNGDKDQAIKMYLEALAAAETRGDLDSVYTLANFIYRYTPGDADTNAVKVAMRLKMAEARLKYEQQKQRKSAEEAEKNGDFAVAALQYSSLGDEKKAEEMRLKAEEVEKHRKEAEKLSNLSIAADVMGRGDIEHAADLYETAGDKKQANELRSRFAKQYEESNPERAASLYEKAGNKDKAKESELKVAQQYEASGNFDFASKWYSLAGNTAKVEELKPKILLQQAQDCERIDDFKGAAAIYEQLRDKVAAKTAKLKAAQQYEQRGLLESAADLYEQTGDKKKAKELRARSKREWKEKCKSWVPPRIPFDADGDDYGRDGLMYDLMCDPRSGNHNPHGKNLKERLKTLKSPPRLPPGDDDPDNR